MSDKVVAVVICIIVLFGVALWACIECELGWEKVRKNSKDSVKEFQESWARDAETTALKGRMRDVEHKINDIDAVLTVIEKNMKDVFEEQKKLRKMIPLEKQIDDYKKQLNKYLKKEKSGLKIVDAYEQDGKAIFEMSTEFHTPSYAEEQLEWAERE